MAIGNYASALGTKSGDRLIREIAVSSVGMMMTSRRSSHSVSLELKLNSERRARNLCASFGCRVASSSIYFNLTISRNAHQGNVSMSALIWQPVGRNVEISEMVFLLPTAPHPLHNALLGQTCKRHSLTPEYPKLTQSMPIWAWRGAQSRSMANILFTCSSKKLKTIKSYGGEWIVMITASMLDTPDVLGPIRRLGQELKGNSFMPFWDT